MEGKYRDQECIHENIKVKGSHIGGGRGNEGLMSLAMILKGFEDRGFNLPVAYLPADSGGLCNSGGRGTEGKGSLIPHKMFKGVDLVREEVNVCYFQNSLGLH